MKLVAKEKNNSRALYFTNIISMDEKISRPYEKNYTVYELLFSIALIHYYLIKHL